MGIATLRKLKKDQSKKKITTYINTVIAGKGPFAVLLWDKLSVQKSDDDLLLITGDLLTQYDLCPWGPATLRGEENINHFKTMFPQIKVNVSNNKSKFFKDQEFKEFGGRSKSEVLLFGEKFYTLKAGDIDYHDVFKYIQDDNFLNMLNEKVSTEIISKVDKLGSEDMLSEKKWRITFASGNAVECENLVWGFPICDLFNLMDLTSLFHVDFVEFYNMTGTVSNIFVRFELEGEIRETGTIFIPLSYTHEWGHFIGEFHNNTVEFIHHLDKEKITEDEVAKRIKILKRSFEKIFTDLKIKELGEYIYFSAEASTNQIDVEANDLDGNNIFFLGVNAPLSDINPIVTNFSRALLSVDQVEHSLIGE